MFDFFFLVNCVGYRHGDSTQRLQTENVTTHFESLNIEGSQPIQQQPVPVWPNMLQPKNLIPHNDLPRFNCNI